MTAMISYKPRSQKLMKHLTVMCTDAFEQIFTGRNLHSIVQKSNTVVFLFPFCLFLFNMYIDI